MLVKGIILFMKDIVSRIEVKEILTLLKWSQDFLLFISNSYFGIYKNITHSLLK